MDILENWQTLVSILALIATIVIQIWQQRDHSRQSNSQVDLDQDKHELDVQKTSSEITTSQSKLQLDITVRLREELEASNARYKLLEKDFEQFRDQCSKKNEEEAVLLDMLDCITEYSESQIKPILQASRQFRRRWHV